MISRLKVFDAHFHIIDDRFPLIPNNGYVPDSFTCDDYLVRMRDYNLAGGAVVSGSFQGFDQSYLLDALQRLGPGYVGVTQLPVDVTDDEIQMLHHGGVRALRFNVKQGGSAGIEHLDTLARHVYEVAGWHTELYIDATALPELYNQIVGLPAVSIDHLGLSQQGFNTLLKLVEHGVHVKATGFGRVDLDIPAALTRIYAANPKALMFGTDLPSTRAPRPYCDSDCDLIIETLGEDQARQVLHDNAIAWYGLKQTT